MVRVVSTIRLSRRAKSEALGVVRGAVPPRANSLAPEERAMIVLPVEPVRTWRSRLVRDVPDHAEDGRRRLHVERERCGAAGQTKGRLGF